MLRPRVRRLCLACPLVAVLATGCFLVIGEIPEGSRGDTGGAAGSSGGASGSETGGSAGTAGSAGTPCVVPPCDCDDDGYGKIGCAGGTNNDCDDSDPDAFPGQPMFFTQPRNDGTGYDYDCDGDTTPKWTATVTCSVPLLDCPPQTVQGYTNGIPQCGQAADYGYCKQNGLCDPVVVEQRTQECH